MTKRANAETIALCKKNIMIDSFRLFRSAIITFNNTINKYIFLPVFLLLFRTVPQATLRIYRTTMDIPLPYPAAIMAARPTIQSKHRLKRIPKGKISYINLFDTIPQPVEIEKVQFTYYKLRPRTVIPSELF
jgi:hypothetical protein